MILVAQVIAMLVAYFYLAPAVALAVITAVFMSPRVTASYPALRWYERIAAWFILAYYALYWGLQWPYYAWEQEKKDREHRKYIRDYMRSH